MVAVPHEEDEAASVGLPAKCSRTSSGYDVFRLLSLVVSCKHQGVKAMKRWPAPPLQRNASPSERSLGRLPAPIAALLSKPFTSVPRSPGRIAVMNPTLHSSRKKYLCMLVLFFNIHVLTAAVLGSGPRLEEVT